VVDKVSVTIVSPEQHFLTDDVDMVVVPGSEGDIGVLPRHAAMISSLRPGIVTLYRGEEKQHIFLSSGFVDINEKACLVLAENCEYVTDMNFEELESYAQRLSEELQIARTQAEKDELEEIRKMTLYKVEMIRKLKAH